MFMEEETGILLVDLFGLVIEILAPQFGDFVEEVKTIKEEQKALDNTFKIIEKARSSAGLSDLMYYQINKQSHGSGLLEFEMISTAVKTNKWINYALWCMCDEESVLLKADDYAKELVNAIGMMGGYGKIYESAGIADLNEYDICNEDIDHYPVFVLSIHDLQEKFANEKFRKAMRLKLAKKQAAANSRLISPGGSMFSTLIAMGQNPQPILFSNTSLKEVLGDKKGDLNDDLFNRLESSIGKLVNGIPYKYSIDRMSGLPILTIQRDTTYGATENFLLDDGRITGGTEVSILGTFMGPDGSLNKVFVNAKRCPDIAYKVINIAFYQLTAEELESAKNCFHTNPTIYFNVDFNNTFWFDFLSDEDKKELFEHLDYIQVHIKNDPKFMYYNPRLRFKDFADVHNFKLISDDQVVFPFVAFGMTDTMVYPGLQITCENGILSRQQLTQTPVQQ